METDSPGKILVLDNYDSFTWNLVHYIETITGTVPDVFRNDRITVEDAGRYPNIVLSPGPGLPSEAGILVPLIIAYKQTKNILGICLGMQAIGIAFGASLRNLATVHHGVAREVTVTDSGAPLFREIPERFMAGRYHSWAVDAGTLPPELKITAVDAAGEVMALAHANGRVHGMQFHPESIMTPVGRQLLSNWIRSCGQHT